MSIANKKIKLEIMKMDANIIDAEIRIEERLEEVKRVEESIKKYKEKKDELIIKLGEE